MEMIDYRSHAGSAKPAERNEVGTKSEMPATYGEVKNALSLFEGVVPIIS